jgi:hypothetical protein
MVSGPCLRARVRVSPHCNQAISRPPTDDAWSVRLSHGGDVMLPAEHADLVERAFRKSFCEQCIAADGTFVQITDDSEVSGVTKLKIEVTANGGGRAYTGLKMDTPIALAAADVRAHFTQRFLDKCADADHRGRFVSVPVGAAQDHPNPLCASLGAPCEPASSGGLGSCRKPVEYRDVGKKGLCAPYGLASALHDLGACDNQGADLGARIAKAAPKLARGDDAIKACVFEMRQAGWQVDQAFTERGSFSPTRHVTRNPALVQLTEDHAVAIVGDDAGQWIYDPNEEQALPLTHDSLSRCMGAGRRYESHGCKRAYSFAPGKQALKAAKRTSPKGLRGRRVHDSSVG